MSRADQESQPQCVFSPSRRLWTHLTLFVLAMLASVNSSFGALQTDAADRTRAEAWINLQLTIGPEQRIPALVKITFSTTRKTTKSAAEIEKLKNEIKAIPNHPKQWDVQNWARLAKHEHISTHVVWLLNDKTWRLCSDRDDGETVTFSDRGRNDQETWELTPAHLGTLDNAAMALPQMRNPPAVLTSLISSSIQRFFGGIGFLPAGSPKLESLIEDQGQWLATIFSTAGRHRIWFAWISECEAFYPTKVEILANADSSVMTTWTYDRPFLGVGQQPTCKRVVFHSPGIGHDETYLLESCESTTAEEVMEHARTPAPDQTDVVRGRASIHAISYARGSDSFVKTITPQGETITRTPPPDRLTGQQPRALWYITSGTAVVAVGFVLALKLRRV